MSTLNTTLHVVSPKAYQAQPESQTVTQANTTLVYQLDEVSNQSWRITGLTTTDQSRQLSAPVIGNNGQMISVVDANTAAETFSITIKLKHRESGDEMGADPMVKNEPD